MAHSRTLPNHTNWIFFAIFLALLAMPLLWLGQHDRLGGLPLGIAGLVVILARDVQNHPSRKRSGKSLALMMTVAAVTIYLVARAGGGTALQLIGLGLLVGAWLLRLFEPRRMGGIFCLLFLVCLPLGLLQGNLLMAFQRLAAEMASWLLDFGSVAHVRQGMILESARGALFVEEACSGMRSLITGLVVAQIYFCWHRKGLWFSVMGLACCGALLLLGNSLRIGMVAWLYISLGIDWTKGWSRELSGLAVCLFVFVLLPSLKSLQEMVWSRLVLTFLPKKRVKDGSRSLPREEEPFGYKPFTSLRILVASMSPALCAGLGIMVMAAIAEWIVFRTQDAPAVAVDVKGLPRLEAINLPEELAGWKKDPNPSEVTFIEKIALNQRVWTYQKAGMRAWVAAGLPYDHVHPLSLCYINRDWVIKNQGVELDGSNRKSSFFELISKEGGRPPMLVCYDHFNLGTQSYVGGPPDRIDTRLGILFSRLKGERGISPATQGPFCQLQVVQAGVSDFNSADGRSTLELLNASRVFFASHLPLDSPD